MGGIFMKKLLIVMLMIISIIQMVGCTKDEVKIELMSLGGNHSAAISTTGQIYTWGLNFRGQLGDGTNTNKSIPKNITGQFNFKNDELVNYISLGFGYSALITSTNRVFTFGYNGYGQLGDGTTVDRFTPLDITDQFELYSGETMITILIEEHAAALTSSGRLFTWGYNLYGQLGDGTTQNRLKPTDITGNLNLETNETVKQISLGTHQTAALTSTGRIFVWGANRSYALGDGTQIDQLLPKEITNQFDLGIEESINQVYLGNGYGSALTSIGRIFTWGYNKNGQLGDGSTISKPGPIDITPQFNFEEGETIKQLSLGDNHAGALTTLGRIFRWGDNMFGQSGDDIKTDDLLPIDITRQFNLYKNEKILHIELGSFHSAVITTNGRIFTWGNNDYGQLGNNKISDYGLITDITKRF